MEDPEIPNCTWAVHAEDDGILEMMGFFLGGGYLMNRLH